MKSNIFKFPLSRISFFTFLTAIVIIFISCNDKVSEYYKRPDWITGSAYDVLKEKGNYNLFLEAVDVTGYKDIIGGNSIVTVMAPDDDAFKAYMQENNYNKITDIPSVELDKLVSFHILYYSFSKERFVNFRPEEGDDCTEEEKAIKAGLFYKFRTRSKDANTEEFDIDRNLNISVYHFERYLPVFSYKYFQSKGIDAKNNYEYFFPDTEWKGDEGFNVSNASVKEYENIASNGYVYEINKVLKPLNTIYQELQKNSDFSEFLAMYDKYSFYSLSDDLTQEFGNGTKLYLHYHAFPMADIALEWADANYLAFASNCSKSYSVFAPTNQAINDFFDDYWKIGGYSSLAEVSSTSIKSLLLNCVYADDLVFPDEIINKKVINKTDNSIIEFDVLSENVVPKEYRIMCENGALYGCKQLAAPAKFISVTGPAYQYKNYLYYLELLHCLGNNENAFWSTRARYISLMPSNDQVTYAGFFYNPKTKKLCTDATGTFAVSDKSYAYGHIIDLAATPGNYTDFTTSGYGVFRTASPDYTYYVYSRKGPKGNLQLSNSFKFNEIIYPPVGEVSVSEDNVFYDAEEIKYKNGEWINGKSYAYKDVLFVSKPNDVRLQYTTFASLMYYSGTNYSLPYYGFYNLMVKAGLYNVKAFSLPTTETTFLMLIPTTKAIEEALINNAIPGVKLVSQYDKTKNLFSQIEVTNNETLQNYMLNYFIPLSGAGISNYPFLGWEEDISKGMETLNESEVAGKTVISKVIIKDKGNSLSANLNGGNYIDFLPDYHYLPFIFNDGCVQFLQKCF